MHGALKDWLHLGVGVAENADMSPDTILVGTAFVGHIVVATNGFILRGACLAYRRRGQGTGEWIACGRLWWGAHVQGMQMLVDSRPCPGVRRLLVRLEMVNEVQEDTFEAVLFEAFPH